MKILSVIGQRTQATVNYKLIDNVVRSKQFSCKVARDEIEKQLSDEETALFGKCTDRIVIRTRPGHVRNNILMAFAKGCLTSGYVPVMVPLKNTKFKGKAAAVVIWGLHAGADEVLKECRKRNEKVIVLDLAMTGLLRPDYYQACLNGLNKLPEKGNSERAKDLKLIACNRAKRGKDAPFLILGQCPGDKQHNLANPDGWAKKITAELEQYKRPVVFRPHPKVRKSETSLAEDLAQAYCVVTYNSNGAVEAFQAGVPVICDPSASYADCGNKMGDKITFSKENIQNYLDRMSAVNFTLDEIRAGLPIQQLLGENENESRNHFNF